MKIRAPEDMKASGLKERIASAELNSELDLYEGSLNGHTDLIAADFDYNLIANEMKAS